MIQEILDEVLDTSLQPDTNPRYTIKDNNGRIINDNVQIDFKTPVVQNPTPLNRATMSNIQGDLYTQDRYSTPTYSGTAMTLNLPLTSYEVGKIIRITAPATLTNPTLNINKLGAKQINATIASGEKYDLIYNGTNWDIREKDYVTGIYTGNSVGNDAGLQTQDIILGFTPKAVWVIAKNDDEFNATNFGLAVTNNYILPNTNFSSGTPVKIIDNGFRVAFQKTSANASALVATNLGGAVFMYLAFK